MNLGARMAGTSILPRASGGAPITFARLAATLKQMLKHSRPRDDICSKNILAFPGRKTYNPGLRTKLKVNQALPHDRAHR